MSSLLLAVFGIIFTILKHDVFAQVEVGHVELGCPEGYYRHGDICYDVGHFDEVTYREAVALCNRDGRGSLAIIKDYDTNVFLHRLRMRNFLHCYWFGLNDKNAEGRWAYDDGTRADIYTNWDVGEPNNNGGVQDCASLLMHKGLKWDDEFCYMNFLYVCEFPASKCTEKSNVLDKICYQPSHHFAPYNEATTACKTLGGQLAVINSAKIDAHIRSIIYNDTFWLTMSEDEIKDVYAGLALKFTWIRGSWIGIQNKDNKWINVDNTTTSFKQWSSGSSPSYRKTCATLGQRMNPYSCGISYSYGKTDYSHAEIEECYQYAVGWNPTDCNEKNSYICQYPAVIDPTKATEPLNTGIVPTGMQTDKDKNVDSAKEGTQGYSAMQKDNEIAPDGIHMGVAPFVLLIISCLLIGMLLTVVAFGAYIMKRNREDNSYQSMRALIESSKADP